MSAVLDAGIHEVLVLMPGYYKAPVPDNAIYWAHISTGYAGFRLYIPFLGGC